MGEKKSIVYQGLPLTFLFWASYPAKIAILQTITCTTLFPIPLTLQSMVDQSLWSTIGQLSCLATQACVDLFSTLCTNGLMLHLWKKSLCMATKTYKFLHIGCSIALGDTRVCSLLWAHRGLMNTCDSISYYQPFLISKEKWLVIRDYIDSTAWNLSASHPNTEDNAD